MGRRRDGQEALDLAERRLALALEATGAGVYDHFVPPDRGPYHGGERWAEILGYAAAELPPKERLLAWLHARIDPDDVPRLQRAYADFIEGRTPEFAAEARIRRKSGEWVWVRCLARAAARDRDGRVVRVVGAVLDITDRKRRDEEREALLARERAARLEAERARERYRRVVEGLGCIVFEAEPGEPSGGGMRFTLVNGRVEELLGYPVERWYEPGFWPDEVVHPDDRPRVRRAFEARAGGGDRPREDEFRAVAGDGHEVWLRSLIRHEPAFPGNEGGGGGGAGLVRGIMVDVTGHRRVQERERFLAAEVDHRAKNALAAVQSMVLQTEAAATSVPEFAEVLAARIHAMARAHDLLARNEWRGAWLHHLLRDTFENIGAAPDGEAVRIEGDDAFVPARAAQALRMALHELAMNAAKHGALSRPDGRVTVTSSVEELPPAAGRAGQGFVVVRWVEAGGPEVASPPERRGFGSNLIERGLAYEADATAELEFAPGGLRCYIRVPLAGVTAP